MKIRYYLYALTKNDDIFYIGITCNLDSRLKSHIKRFGDLTDMVILYKSDVERGWYGCSSYMQKIESALINICIDNGINLLNKIKSYKFNRCHYKISYTIFSNSILKSQNQ